MYIYICTLRVWTCSQCIAPVVVTPSSVHFNALTRRETYTNRCFGFCVCVGVVLTSLKYVSLYFGNKVAKLLSSSIPVGLSSRLISTCFQCSTPSWSHGLSFLCFGILRHLLLLSLSLSCRILRNSSLSVLPDFEEVISLCLTGF